MILHIEFTDGSNPYLMYGDAEAVKMNCKWYIDHIPEARPLIMAGSLKCRRVAGGGWAVAPYFDGAHKTRHFETLGRAIGYLKREDARAV